MRTLTYQLRDLKKVIIEIGFEGENNRTQVRIDCGEVFAEYPNAEAAMKVQAPKGGIYPATVTRDGNMILWTVRDCDVANNGNGEFQLTFTDGETVVKSCRGRIHIDKSLKGSGTAPSGVQDWLERAEEVLEGVEAAEIHQPMIGLDGYWYKWDQEAKEYVSTGTKAQGQDGVGIASIVKTGTVGLVDTYTITFTNGTTTTYTVTNGEGGTVIDDTTPASDKVFSSEKVNTELNTVKSALQQDDGLKQTKPYSDAIDNITYTRNMAIVNGNVITHTGNPTPEDIVTSAISVAGLEKVTIKAKARWSCDFYAFYSANNTLISRKQCDSTGATIDTFNGEVEVPENATKLYVAYITSSSTAEPDTKLATGIVYHDINLNDYLIDKKQIENLESFADLRNVVSPDMWDSNNLLNGYYGTDGIFVPDNTYKSCNFVDISSYDYVILTFSFYTNMPVIYDIWDVNKSLLSGTRENKAAGVDLVVRINVSEGYKYLTVNNRDNNNPTIIGYKESKAVNTIRKGLKGKKISFLGDSITTYANYIPSGNENYYTGSNCGVTSVDQTWWKRVIDYCGMELLVNNSWSGATISDVRDSYAPGSSGIDRCEYLHSGTTNPDVIIVYMGTNDFRNDVPMGTYDGSQTFPTTESTFREAVAIMLKKILTKYPNAITYICTLKQFEHYGDVEGFPDTNGQGLTTDDYTNALLAMATLFGVPVIDFNKSGLNYFNLEQYCGDYSSQTGKGLHPNSAGMKKLAERAMKDIIPNII